MKNCRFLLISVQQPTNTSNQMISETGFSNIILPSIWFSTEGWSFPSLCMDEESGCTSV